MGHAVQECSSETSVTNYQSTPCKIPEERRSHLHRGGNLKSRRRRYFKNMMGRVFYTGDGNDKCSQNFGQKTLWKETQSRCGAQDTHCYDTELCCKWVLPPKMPGACFSKLLVPTHQSTQCPNLNDHCMIDKFSSHILLTTVSNGRRLCHYTRD
jgi:hypothetical protein